MTFIFDCSYIRMGAVYYSIFSRREKTFFCIFWRFVTLLAKSKFKVTFFGLLCVFSRYLSLLIVKLLDMVGV